MKFSALIAVALCATPVLAQDGDASDRFEEPVELLTNGASIDSVMYPSPTLYDLDGDGKRELVIGDIFGSIHSCIKSDGKTNAWGEMVKLKSVDGKPLQLNNW
jgi:hypothetical protein